MKKDEIVALGTYELCAGYFICLKKKHADYDEIVDWGHFLCKKLKEEYGVRAIVTLNRNDFLYSDYDDCFTSYYENVSMAKDATFDHLRERILSKTNPEIVMLMCKTVEEYKDYLLSKPTYDNIIF